MKTDIRDEHRWLHRLIGAWRFEGGCETEGEPSGRFEGRETVRGLGEAWIIGEGEGHSPEGQPHRSLMTLGYDPARGRFVGNFVSSMMTHQWVYEGGLSGETLVLDTMGPSFTGEDGLVAYQDIITFEADGVRRLTSRMRQNSGWKQVVEAVYRREG
ncbi:DUF1579 domain-containing protein [Teichococcus oryzae]|uniref:DUF1579 domain-containing protein n=1 Tax=Teichococcus oryzae TaxID=1608942 RepID=A0A5B2TIC1_9PROT|nr:DUF1579 domain-containing protein [Pseudoroseomonas oryzae]KAA2213844.1 DUF1579 domain-containing protein [Pseudoroseomonas oryzae]